MSDSVTVERSPIEQYLRQQQDMGTPVERFSKLHDAGGPAMAPYYRDLIPLSQPKPGEQYAFEVDMDACTGCKACVAACHSLNGLEEEETWRDVGLIVGGSGNAPYQQTITSACHHCEDPGCLNGCPVLAYEKDPLTGIVRHLDDQCIGCQYCVLKCPYDVPKFSERLGIVRKCDMCHGRLAEGEAPACVQACPTQAIKITIVSRTAPAAEKPANDAFLAAAPAPEYTRPTTRYISQRPVPANARAADTEVLRPQHAHTPLVAMLTLTQAAVGLQTAATLTNHPLWLEAITAVLLGAGLTASILHLGRPLGAWRAFLGLRRSWLSREIVLFGGYAPAFFSLVAVHHFLFALPLPVWGGLTLLGWLAVGSSMMIYHDTHRRFWHWPRTSLRFFGVAATATLSGLSLATGPLWGLAAAGALATKLFLEFRPLWAKGTSSVSTRLMRGPLRRWTLARAAWGGGAIAAWLASVALGLPLLAGLAGLLFLVGEFCERVLFFKAVDAPKMPGGMTA
ncbi:MAG: DmsC/YnfH family molybdoenzyme membrane anchor subunit [Verrucomicrobiota bacterium JB022]|nr:DmsC/YnfH family molybdoenzyme membrane anchor subunit [Verrucomicrobiota bacterium JB022]